MANYKTYAFMANKVQADLDLLDETFIPPQELVGYANEAIKEAESEILTLRQDYFLTNVLYNMTPGAALFSYPGNIYGMKIRGLVYTNAAIIYTMRRYLQQYQFEDIAYTLQFGASDEYRYIVRNDSPGNPQMQLVPASRDTGPYMQCWYIREAQRVPLLGEFYNTEPILFSAVNSSTSVITVAAGTFPSAAGFSYNPIAYVTGDQVQVYLDPLNSASALPGGLSVNTTYYVIALTATTIQLATTLANALAGTYISLTAPPVGDFVLTVAGTANIQQATLIDIPEFVEFLMAWMKVRCFMKEGDPRYEAAVAELQQQRKQMVDTLTEISEEHANLVEGDFSNYLEFS